MLRVVFNVRDWVFIINQFNFSDHYRQSHRCWCLATRKESGRGWIRTVWQRLYDGNNYWWWCQWIHSRSGMSKYYLFNSVTDFFMGCTARKSDISIWVKVAKENVSATLYSSKLKESYSYLISVEVRGLGGCRLSSWAQIYLSWANVCTEIHCEQEIYAKVVKYLNMTITGFSNV